MVYKWPWLATSNFSKTLLFYFYLYRQYQSSSDQIQLAALQNTANIHAADEDFGVDTLTVSPVALFLKPYVLFSVHIKEKFLTYHIKFRQTNSNSKNYLVGRKMTKINI
jgi:hypothetical protein